MILVIMWTVDISYPVHDAPGDPMSTITTHRTITMAIMDPTITTPNIQTTTLKPQVATLKPQVATFKTQTATLNTQPMEVAVAPRKPLLRRSHVVLTALPRLLKGLAVRTVPQKLLQLKALVVLIAQIKPMATCMDTTVPTPKHSTRQTEAIMP